jgi:3-isopropylmalate/(R)-2-methylmalate dehydratase small subunit
MSVKKGKAWVFGDDVDTDLIYHNKYLAETDPNAMPQYAFEYYPGKEHFANAVQAGDFIIAGKNFGCGSSREHAVYCLQYAGIPCLLVETCSRIYYRNAINNGYPVLFIKGLSEAIEKGMFKDGDRIEVDFENGTVYDLDTDVHLQGDGVGNLEKDIMEAGGLFPYLKRQIG